jgi:hypothetical protein
MFYMETTSVRPSVPLSVTLLAAKPFVGFS